MMRPRDERPRGEGAWDVVVIGAGPAGSVAARECARRGVRVLLIDKVGFPRWKVCGCCLNAAAMGVLERIGLGSLPRRLHARAIEKLNLVSARGGRAGLLLHGGVSVSRWALDEALVSEAARAGCEVLLGRAAAVGSVEGEFRRVRVAGEDCERRARMVIAADGLAGTSLAGLPEFELEVVERSRVGIGCVVEDAPAFFERGAISMVCGRKGYVGGVWLEDGTLDVAAAVDAEWMKRVGGPCAAVDWVFSEAGVPRVEGLKSVGWRGTPKLTRRRRVEGERVLVIGDAAGYVEPFTGEGMAWAMISGEAAAGCAVGRGGVGWAAAHRELVGVRQRECWLIARVLRHSGLSSAMITVLGAAPVLAGPMVRRISQAAPPREVATS